MHALRVPIAILGLLHWASSSLAETGNWKTVKDSIVSVRWQATGEAGEYPQAPVGALFWQQLDDTSQTDTSQTDTSQKTEEEAVDSDRTAISLAVKAQSPGAYINPPPRATGFVVGNHIVTMLTAAARASDGLTVIDHSGQESPAKVVAWDPSTSLTALRWQETATKPSTSLQLAEGAVSWGEDIRVAHQWKAGNPALVLGIVSTSPEFDAVMRANIFDVDARIGLQAVGAPVLNARQEVVGIIAAQRADPSMPASGIAVAADSILELLKFVAAGRTGGLPCPMIGAMLNVAEQRVRIRGVREAAPAQIAGLRPGDVIVSIDNVEVTTPSDVIAAIDRHASGDSVNVQVERDGQELQVNVVLQAVEPSDPPASTSIKATYLVPPNFFITPPAGLTEEQRAAIRLRTTAWIFENPPAPHAAGAVPDNLEGQLKQLKQELAEIKSLLQKRSDR